MFASVAKFMTEGGSFMWWITLVAVVGLAIAIERTVFLFFRFNVDGNAFMDQIRKLVMANNIDRAIKLCAQAKQAALPRVVKAGLQKANKGETEIANAVEEAILEVLPEITKRTDNLTTIAQVATYLGLLGTIFGMIQAFAEVSRSGEALGKTELLAAGIYQAMVTTAAGLIVAIPALIFYHFLVSKVERLVMEIDEMTVNFVDEYAVRRAESKSVIAPASENGAAGRGQKAEISGPHAGRGIEAAQAATATTGARA